MLRGLFMTKLLILSLLGTLSFAKISSVDTRATILCIEEVSNGFNWKNGEYVPTKFTLDKKLIKKVSNKECSSKPYKYDYMGSSEGCYKIDTFGEEESKYAYSCNEIWKTDKENKPEYITQVQCGKFENIRFQPNGNFIFSRTTNDLSSKPKNGQKDSMYISAGKCSIISQ